MHISVSNQLNDDRDKEDDGNCVKIVVIMSIIIALTFPS